MERNLQPVLDWSCRKTKFVAYSETCLLFLILLLGASCSENQPGQDSRPTYIPFENQKKKHPPKAELAKLLNRKDLAHIAPGEFWMGSPRDESGRKSDEVLHKVKITNPFWIKRFEVSNREWNQFVDEDQKKGEQVFWITGKILDKLCSSSGYQDAHYSIHSLKEAGALHFTFRESSGSNDSWKSVQGGRNYKIQQGKFTDLEEIYSFLAKHKNKQVGRLNQNFPATHISYSQAVNYCWKRTKDAYKKKELPKNLVYRLPTEAEWEYSCRAGNAGFTGLADGDYLSGENANLDGSSSSYILDERPDLSSGSRAFRPFNRRTLSEIRLNSPLYPGNQWGIHDTHGNVMEWCFDYYGNYSIEDIVTNPIGPIRGSKKVVRGGSFYRTAQECRSASRASYEPSYRGSEIGFRYVIGFPLR